MPLIEWQRTCSRFISSSFAFVLRYVLARTGSILYIQIVVKQNIIFSKSFKTHQLFVKDSQTPVCVCVERLTKSLVVFAAFNLPRI